MAFDYRKLRGRIVEIYGTQAEFAKAIGISNRTVSLKMNNKVRISQDEVVNWSKKLNIDSKEITDYFFTQKVSKT
jgi:hypothetical protein